MVVFAKVLPEEQRKLATALISKGQLGLKYTVRTSCYSLDRVSRAVFSALSLRQCLGPKGDKVGQL